MDGTSLSPELERFAADAVAAGRYRDISEVLRAGLELLKRRDEARAELLASVLAAKSEGDQEGYLTADDVAAHVRDTIVQGIRAKA